MTNCRFIITYYPALYLVEDTVENLIATWREGETCPRKALLILLPISPACELVCSESPFLKTQNQGVSLGTYMYLQVWAEISDVQV